MMIDKNNVSALIKGTIDSLQNAFDSEHLESVKQIAEIVYKALQNGKKILLCGNGGSAADSQHIAAEFVGRFKKERKSYPAIALTTDTSILTAVGNDYGYECVFSRQVEGLGEEGDVLIGISTSGSSPNVLRAVESAKRIGMKTIALSGAGGGKLTGKVDELLTIETNNTPDVQAGHIIVLHTICEVVENALCNNE